MNGSEDYTPVGIRLDQIRDDEKALRADLRRQGERLTAVEMDLHAINTSIKLIKGVVAFVVSPLLVAILLRVFEVVGK